MAYPKGQRIGGRQKGTPNATTATLRMQIRKADPVAFLIEVMEGKKLYEESIVDETGRVKHVKVKPPIAARRDSAKFLAERIVPAMKAVQFTDEEGNTRDVFGELARKMLER